MEFESNPTQDSPIPESSSGSGGLIIFPEALLTFPPIAGFWRRLFAWMIDSLILGVIGQIIGFTFSAFLYSIGPYGRPIGLLFIIPYFGILNSKIGGGQTLGKRWMKIAVRNKNNEPVELWRSIVRILILAIPAMFNVWAVPLPGNFLTALFLPMIIFGLGGAIFYTMLFNRKSRQGIHDLLLGTYVVHLEGRSTAAFPTTPRIHWIVSSVWFGLVALVAMVAFFLPHGLISPTPLASASAVYDLLADDPRFFSVGVNDQTMFGQGGKTSHSLIIEAWYRGKLEENSNKQIVSEIAKKVLENAKNLNQYDAMQIKITSSFDIGIASGNTSVWFMNSIAGWRKETPANPGVTGFN